MGVLLARRRPIHQNKADPGRCVVYEYARRLKYLRFWVTVVNTQRVANLVEDTDAAANFEE